VAITDNTQAIVNQYSYDAFGNVANQLENTILQNQPFKYVGQYGVMTEPNGFYYMKARYYDPAVGRFISEDPIGFGGGDVNLMAYVGNNPVTGIDPSGLWNFEVHEPSGNQFVDDNFATGPFSFSGYGNHWNVNRDDALTGMMNATSKTEFDTYHHSWQDSWNPAHNGFMAPLQHLALWIPYIVTLGNDNYNPDSIRGPYHAQYLQMQKADNFTWEQVQQQRGSSCSK
jgi:RHS repeat-associated protein